ncbi:MAG: PAS domain-containing protein [Desulfamplus sp.]|nr:PAS domain-containing protein [Desulfamplus sp.]
MAQKPTYEELEQMIQELEKAESVSKKAETTLRASEFLFSQIFEQSTTSTCFYNPEGTIVRVNQAFCKMFGVEKNTILNSGYNVFNDQAAIYSGIIPLLRDIFNEKKTKNWEFNFDIGLASESTKTPTSKTGKVFLEVFGYPVLNREGNLEYVVLQHYDITQRKRTEAALLESKIQKSAILNGITTNIALVDKDLNILWTNKAAAASVNKLPEEMVGRTCHFFWADPNKPCNQCPTIKAFQTKKSEHTIMHTPDGRFWEERGEPVLDTEGNVVAVVEIAHDVTERKRAEKALAQKSKLL